MARAFYRLGALCSGSPALVALMALLCSCVLCLGLLDMRLQTDPQGLWVPPHSVAAQEQARFDALFGPFFRVQQLIFHTQQDAADASCDAAHDLVQRRFLLQMANVQTRIATAALEAQDARGANVTLSLEDLCYRPIRGKGCLVTSPFQLWLGNASLLRQDPDVKLTAACQTTEPALQERAPCMDQNGVPVMRDVVFGGLARDDCHQNPDPCGEATPQAQALVVTFLLHNRPENETYTRLVQQWEQQVFLKIAAEAAEALKPSGRNASDEFIWDSVQDQELADVGVDGMRLAYMAERSVADSLVVQTKQNAFIVVVSYLVMFFYVSASLGKFSDPVRSRFGLGLTGILIVLLSLGAAMGVSCAILQMEVTMITLEVVPFLVLAIGVDNMFILTNEFDRLAALRGLTTLDTKRNTRDRAEDELLMLKQVLGETMVNVGPSIVVAAVAETLAFLVGALTRIPALTSFCVVAALAVAANFALQMTWFASALVLDARRVRARRYDLFPWVKQKLTLTPPTKGKRRFESKVHYQYDLLVDENDPVDESPVRTTNTGSIQRFVEKTYIPFLLRRSTKVLVLVTALSVITLSAFGSSELPLGLEQELAVPTDFYLHEYFKKQTALGEAGPPAYVVLDSNVDYRDAQLQQDVNVLLDQLSGLRQYIQLPVYSWLHTFNQWRQMRFFLEDKIKQGQCDCPVQPMDPFPYELANIGVDKPREDVFLAAPEYGYGARSIANVTPNALFYPLVKNFTQISIDSSCCQHFGLCGAQYEGDIIFNEPKPSDDTASMSIVGSRMRFQLNALRNQSMFVNSYYYLHDVVGRWSVDHSATAFPYALVFVYEEQYTYIQGVALQSVLLALAVVFGALFVLMDGSLRLTTVVTLCVLSMAFSQLGFLFVWNVIAGPGAETSINAVSVPTTTHVLLSLIGQPQKYPNDLSSFLLSEERDDEFEDEVSVFK
ncbi:Resistance-Nodulation-Cell Division (RND) Superfamily [Phytophthora cinnamomi]|uniref:Resistance-Nodulation-Cell Division (RND) Superfamily n=1 Tax=Phytophthora cinnamomi TaxID=4785 RepID=UPI00355A6EBB|nr:Resistance-Nodulation-Cell Division (RND) Superfamily [Phytophthora cinnamomi]